MSDNKNTNTQPTNTTTSGSTLTAQPVRVIDNPEIRQRQKEEMGKGKELSRKKQAAKKRAESKRREKQNKKQLQYAREYMEKNNHPPLATPVLTQEQVAELQEKFGELPEGPQGEEDSISARQRDNLDSLGR